MTRFVLTEHVESRIALTRADVALLHGQLERFFDIRPAIDGDGYVINPGSTVGVIRLPSGSQLELQPKIPLGNLLWMLSYAWEVPFEHLDDAIEITRFDDIVEVVADAFSRMVEHRIDLGLYRNYAEEEANLPTVRGRILVAQDVHRNAVLRHRTYCGYTVYSWDLPENQVIRQVVHLLSGWGLSRRLTGRLMALDSQLDEIRPSRLRAPDIDRFVYNRQSRDYQPIHRLCQLFLEGASLSEDSGNKPFDGFLLDMNVLFERFITRALRERLGPPFRLDDQVHITLDQENRVQMRPDLVVSCDGVRKFVADCKYKRLNTGEHKHHDLYQILAYCTAMELNEGMLIYPKHAVDLSTMLTTRGSGKRIREQTVDLSGTPTEMTRELDRLAARIRALGQPLRRIPADTRLSSVS